MLIFAIPAAIQQQRFSPIVKNPPRGLQIDWTRVGIVAVILIVAVVANVIANLKFPALLDVVPFFGLAVWAVILAASPIRRPDWEVMPETFKGTIFLLALVTAASMMPVEKLPSRGMANSARPWFCVRRLRQHPADGARIEAGRLRLGLSRLCGRLRRLDGLVRFVGGCGLDEHVPGSEVGWALASPRLAHRRRLCCRVHRHARPYRMASRCRSQKARATSVSVAETVPSALGNVR